MELDEILEEYANHCVVNELLWAYNNMDELSKKERNSIKFTVMLYMTPDQIKKEFGNKAYNKFLNGD